MADDNELDREPGLPDDWQEQKFAYDLEQLTANFLKAGGKAQDGAAILGRTMTDVMVVAVVQATQDEFAGVLKWCVDSIRMLSGEVPGPADEQKPDEEEDEDVPPDAIDEGKVVDKREAEDGQERQPVFGRRKNRRE